MKRVSKQVGISYYKYINIIQSDCLNKKNVYTYTARIILPVRTKKRTMMMIIIIGYEKTIV